ncbi:MAG TPA: hypothetical protein PK306_12715 [Aquabacterium sp.]|nr:hypothetical protein [Aquabacterium sp.]HQC96561.1 hypothetical protein [Aquabacterium sp.]
MLYIVDGTGPLFDADYAVEMAGSHCNVLHHLNRPDAFYFRGPSLLSALKNTGGIADKVMLKLLEVEFPAALLAPGQRQPPRSPIFLAGHSRGGAAVVLVAQMLDRIGVPVEAMFLFDAVDRTMSLASVETVPKNVRRCFHALRNEGAEVVMAHETTRLWKAVEAAPGYAALRALHKSSGSGPWEQFLVFRAGTDAARWPQLAAAVRAWKAKDTVLASFQVAMRNSFKLTVSAEGGLQPSIPFGNCARKASPSCHYEKEEFACSHGAVGGTPWTTLGDEVAAIDADGARRVWTWMSARMQQHGLKAGSRAT